MGFVRRPAGTTHKLASHNPRPLTPHRAGVPTSTTGQTEMGNTMNEYDKKSQVYC